MLRAENISKRYLRENGDSNYIEAVSGISLKVGRGTMTMITGRSGSGKTTLLHMLAGVLTPTSGKVLLEGEDLYALSDRELSLIRNRRIGVIPQGRSAIDTLTVLENILLPSVIYGKEEPAERARRYMSLFGIDKLENAMPRGLSGGELRRVAIARTLTQNTDIILADEPTGDLDDENAEIVLRELSEAAHRGGKAVVLVTHESWAVRYCDEVVKM